MDFPVIPPLLENPLTEWRSFSMTQKQDEPTLVNSEPAAKIAAGVATSAPQRSNSSTRANSLATLDEIKPLLLALLDKAAEKELPVQKMNIELEGRQVAVIVLPTQQWVPLGKYLTLETVP
jgi:hypothetical protein